jgi:transposase
MLEMQQIFGLPKELEIVDITMMDEVLTISAASTQMHPCCPLCGANAVRMHSHYSRQVADVPCGGQRVRLLLLERKFFCDVTSCARKIFVERLTPFVAPRARVTARLHQVVQAIGLATSGMLGARLAERLVIQVSWMTILRRIMALPTAPVEQVSQLGIDDFSFRRGIPSFIRCLKPITTRSSRNQSAELTANISNVLRNCISSR